MKARHSFLITGSARLDIYRKGDDSMLGRYHYYRLHPFSLAEAASIHTPVKILEELAIPRQKASDLFFLLDKFGGSISIGAEMSLNESGISNCSLKLEA